MKNLWHDLARDTVECILVADDLAPAPLRERRISWRTFLRAHWGAIAAADFFAIETLTLRGLARYVERSSRLARSRTAGMEYDRTILCVRCRDGGRWHPDPSNARCTSPP